MVIYHPFWVIIFFINQFHFRVEYIQLALKYKPLNLGQGFPDFHAPENVTKALAATTTSDNPLLNQYTRGFVSIHLILSISMIIIMEISNMV